MFAFSYFIIVQRLVSDSIQEATAKASRNKMFEQFEGDPPLREQVFAQLAGVEKQLGVLGVCALKWVFNTSHLPSPKIGLQ